jgi:hypothetical protein
MITDKKGKLFGRLNIIDFIALTVVFLLIAGVGYKYVFTGVKSITDNPDLLQYTVSITDVRSYTADALEINDKIYDSKTDTYMGKIISKEVIPYKDYITKTDGNVVLAEKPQRFEVLLTLEVPGVENAYGFLASGKRDINRQSTMQLESYIITVLSKVVDVKKIK